MITIHQLDKKELVKALNQQQLANVEGDYNRLTLDDIRVDNVMF